MGVAGWPAVRPARRRSRRGVRSGSLDRGEDDVVAETGNLGDQPDLAAFVVVVAGEPVGAELVIMTVSPGRKLRTANIPWPLPSGVVRNSHLSDFMDLSPCRTLAFMADVHTSTNLTPASSPPHSRRPPRGAMSGSSDSRIGRSDFADGLAAARGCWGSGGGGPGLSTFEVREARDGPEGPAILPFPPGSDEVNLLGRLRTHALRCGIWGWVPPGILAAMGAVARTAVS